LPWTLKSIPCKPVPMACSATALAPCGSDACCVPAPQGKTNMLGFAGGHPCCTYPCVQFPPFKVRICLTLNADTQATIQQGCATECPTAPSIPGCNLVFGAGQTVDTAGRSCRTITWDRFVPAGAFIRIRLCSSGCGGGVCTLAAGSSGYTNACAAPNALLSFTVNGTDYVEALNAVAAGTGVTGCLIKAACIGNNTGAAATGSTCCDWYTVGASQRVSWGYGIAQGTQNLPIGTELVLGPIGNLPGF